MTDTFTSLPWPEATPGYTPTSVEDLAARLAQMESQLRELRQISIEREAGNDHDSKEEEGEPPLYRTVEEWVRLYLLPTFPRPFAETGMTRWHWCEQWWRHDEAVTRLATLWYGWEHARLQMLGMQPWLRDLDYHLTVLCGDDGPFRNCAPSRDGGPGRHEMPDIAPVSPAPPEWWKWWSKDSK